MHKVAASWVYGSDPKTVKKWPFWSKNGHFDQFLQIQSWYFSDFSYRNSVFGLKKNGQKIFLPKNLNFPFLAPKRSKNCHFGQFLQIQSKDFSDFSHRNSVFGLNKNGQKKFLRKNLNFPFWPKNCNFGQFLQIKS